MLALIVLGVVAMIAGQFFPFVGGIVAAMVAYWWIHTLQVSHWLEKERHLENQIARLQQLEGQDARERQALAEQMLERVRTQASERLAGTDWPAVLVAGGSLVLPIGGLLVCLAFTAGSMFGSR